MKHVEYVFAHLSNIAFGLSCVKAQLNIKWSVTRSTGRFRLLDVEPVNHDDDVLYLPLWKTADG